MKYSQLTPEQRNQYAQYLREKRKALVSPSAAYEEMPSLEMYRAATLAQQAPEPAEDEEVDGGFLEFLGKSAATVLDIAANVTLGAYDMLEGVVDLGAGAVGAIGGAFSEDFRNKVQEMIEYDATGNWLEKPLDDLGLKHSYLNDGEVGKFVGGVARGVGGFLPAVAAAYLTAGTSLAGWASLATTAVGSGGQATEEAYNDGAGYYGGLAYGAAAGAVEGITEKATGGLTKSVFGKGFLDGGKAVADTGAKRILKGMAQEAGEEGFATLVNPALKSTYKGGEAFGEYIEPEFYGDVVKDAAAGAAVGAAFEGTVGRIMKQSGKDADIMGSIEAINDNNHAADDILAEKGELTSEEEQKIRANKEANLKNIEDTLKKASPEQRQKLIKRRGLEGIFNENGEINPDSKAEILGDAVEAPTAQTSAVEEGQGAPAASVSVDNRYVSYELRNNSKKVGADLDKMNNDLRATIRKKNEALLREDPNAAVEDPDSAQIDLYRGELTESEAQVFSTVRKAVNQMSKRTATGLNVALIQSTSQNTDVNASLVGNTVYLSKDALTNGDWAGKLVHEVTHFAEGTKSHQKVLKALGKDTNLVRQVLSELTGKGNPYGFDSINADEYANNRNETFESELGAHLSEAALGSETFMHKIIESDASIAEKLINRIKALKNSLSTVNDPNAKAQVQRLTKAEKLWLKAVDDAGYNYAKGKLVKAIREKREKEEKESATRMNAEKMQDGETEETDVDTDDFDDPQTRAHVNDAQFSLKFSKDIAKAQMEYIDEHNTAITSTELDRAIEQTQEMVDIMSEHSDILPKDTVGKTLVKNGSYDVSVENTTVCIRSLAYNSFVDMVSEKIGRPLTQMESFLVSQKLYEIAREPQCLYCYVSLDRKAYNEMVIRYVEQRDAAIEAWEKAGRPNVTASSQLYKDFLGTRKPTDNMWLRYKSWIDMAKKGEKLLTLEDLSTEAKRSEMTLGTESQKAQVQDILKYAQSASWAKKQTQYVAYKDEILKLPQRTVNALNKHYGLRWYSFSDYSGAFIVENMQQITDAAIRGLKGLAYTKDTDFVKIFAPTGMNINVSVYAMKDGKGGYVIDPKQSADINEAIDLRKKYPNVGIVVVATDNDGVKWALDQGWSDVVIPFHTVRTGADVAAFYDWEVFNKEQADTVMDENLWKAYVDSVAHTDSAKKKVSKNIYPSEHQNDQETYFRILKERGLKARFASFADHPNYMKLVNETRQSERETKKLTPTFSIDSAKEAFNKFVEKGGYYEGWYNDGIDVDGEAEIVAEDVKAGKKPDEVDYALKNVDYEAMQKQRKKNRVHSGGAQFSLSSKSGVDNSAEEGYNDYTYNEEMYNSFGWAVRANAMTKNEVDDLYSKINEKGTFKSFKKSFEGYSIIELNDDPHALLGVDNVFAFVSGTAKAFKVEYVARFNIFSETKIEKLRGDIYGIYKKNTLRRADRIAGLYFAKGLFLGYTRTDWDSYQQYRESLGERSSRDEGERDAGIDRIGDGGKGNSKTVEGDVTTTQFSLSTRDGSAKPAQKYYLREDVEKLVNVIVSDRLHFGDRYGAVDFATKREIVKGLMEKLNTVTSEEQRNRIASDIAEFVIDNAVAQKVLSDKDSAYLASVKQIMHALDLDGIKAEIVERIGAKNSAYLVWGKRKGGKSISLSDAKRIFSENGIDIKATTDAEIFFEITQQYDNLKKKIAEESSDIKEVISSEVIEETKRNIENEILSFAKTEGSAANFSRMVERYERRIKKLNQTITDVVRDSKATNKLLYRVGLLKKVKLGEKHSVKQFNDKRLRDFIGKITKFTRGGTILVTSTRKIFAELDGWYSTENPLFAEKKENGTVEPNLYYREDIKQYIEAIAKGEGRLKADDLIRAEAVVSYLTKLIERYNMVLRNGKYVDAVKIAKGHIDNVRKVKLLPRGMMHTIYRKILKDVVDPATLMRYADGYEAGFFTEIYEDLREGAMKMAFTRMELMEEYDAFIKEHKNFDNHLEELVEFEGVKVPRGVLISAYMTSKREHSHKGFVESGMMFSDKGKNGHLGDTHRIPPLGNPAKKYTDAQIKSMIKEFQAKLYRNFNEADKAYIETVEKIFDRCADLKIETDMEREGVTNVDKKNYYYPIVRGSRPINLDSDSVLEAMERVNNLSMNKDTVKGANAILQIDNVDSVFRRHVSQVSLYHGVAIAVDNFNKLVNLNINEGPGVPVTLASELDTGFYKEALDYLRTMKNDIEGMARMSVSDRRWARWINGIRGKYATFQLGANPKVWVTQLASIISASNLLDTSSLMKGMTMYERKNGDSVAEVDKYCPLAKLRHTENTVVEAQSVMKKSTNKIVEVSMKPIGSFDRFVIDRLWGACQVQVEKNGGAKVGSEANKKAAGDLLTRVILETQQNSLVTERSAMMRSESDLAKSFTMFSADAMKNVGRVFDGIGETHVIKQQLKDQSLSAEERADLQNRLKKSRKRMIRASAALVANALYMAMVATGFKWLLNQLDEDPEKNAWDFIGDAIGNLFGGIPVIRDLVAFITDGYKADNFLFSTINNVWETSKLVFETAEKVADGTASSQDIAGGIRKLMYSFGQLFGIPTRNVYKYTAGLLSRISPSSGYWLESQFTKNPYRVDLQKAIEAGDNKKVEVIAGLITNENYGTQSQAVKDSVRDLASKGYDVLPRTVSDTVTVDGETVELSRQQRKAFEKVYGISDQAVEDLVANKLYQNATDEEKAAALKKLYDTYYNLAVDDVLGTEGEERMVLFSELVDVEVLAILSARANAMEADKDKNGKAIAGSKKDKIVKLVSSLDLTAAQKYAVMAFLGYKNVHGAEQVSAAIDRSDLSKAEKEKLYAYCGYAA